MAETMSMAPAGGEKEHNMDVDTTLAETDVSDFAATHAVQSKPEWPQSPTNYSGSEYSESQSPEKPRPTSIQVAAQSRSSTTAAEEVKDVPQSPTHSGSDYSEPSTPQKRRTDSTHSSAASEYLALGEDHTPVGPRTSSLISSPPALASNSRPSSVKSALPVDTSTSEENPKSETNGVSSEQETPTISISSQPQSPAGSDYSASPPQSPHTPGVEISPKAHHQTHASVGSMQSIALSESSLDYDHLSAKQVEDVLATPKVSGVRHLRRPSSLEILQNTWGPPTRQSTLFDASKDEPLETPLSGPRDDGDDSYFDNTSAWKTESTSSLTTANRESDSSEDIVELDWFTLDKTEEQEKEDKELAEGAEDETTTFLLARLEQENAKFTADPKSTANKSTARVRSKSRPPSMAQLKKLVSKQDTPSIRYSLLPEAQEQLPEDPPPMTELEFWTALVQDYPSTAVRLPTLTTTKIRAGIPLPLRGVVWTSMSGARDKSLEDAFENLKHEKSSYEGIINKDVGRSFPGVELFRDAEGEGQKMLGRVLKCFSLHDKDIGYCQGLGFLVGPLLMNMGEREAFCVLVRLMDHYALRPSFLPSLSGLHMRIFQFSTLLKQHHPELAAHLTELGVEPAYLSQWFLSCFAVTCPLPMLFRIYDVIFAEGANETVMRVALALFRRNEQTMLESTEFEEVMQLLLGRQIWDVYGCNADEMVDDFTSLGNIITHQRLAELEKEFETKDGETVGQSAGFLPDVQAAASRFLGRLWTPTHNHTPSKTPASTLSPASAEKDGAAPGGLLSRPSNFLRRSPSKNSISTVNESSGSEGSTSSMASTAPTDSEVHDAAARESHTDSVSMKSNAESLRTVSLGANQAHTQSGLTDQQEVNAQIEELLMALSEMQREHAQMAAMLQKEREDRNDDHRVVKKLVNRIQKTKLQTPKGKELRRSMPPPSRSYSKDESTKADKRKTLPPRPRPEVKQIPTLLEANGTLEKKEDNQPEDPGLEEIVHEVESRMDTNARFSASLETKAQLRNTLARTREQLHTAETQLKDLSERAELSESSLVTFQEESESLRAEVEELRARVNEEYKEKQKLELTIQNMEIQMRMEAKAVEKKQRVGLLSREQSLGEVPTVSNVGSDSRSRTGSISSNGGLRELKLGRRDSAGSVQSVRSMKSRRQTLEQSPVSSSGANASPSPPTGDVEVTPAPATPPMVQSAEEAPALAPATPVATPAPAQASAHAPSPSLSTPVQSHTRTSSLQAPSHAAPSSLTPQASTHAPSSSLSVPKTPGGFGARTSSLATKSVLTTPQQEPVPDEALLLELVNSKTAEAQARQEVDELKRSLQLQKRRADEAMLEIQAEITSAKLEAEAARAEANRARVETAETNAAEAFDVSSMATPMTPGESVPATPAIEEPPTITEEPEDTTPAKKPLPKKSESQSGGGWFPWARRSPSTTVAGAERSVSEEK